jgi:Protein of unknown function (DUF2842)
LARTLDPATDRDASEENALSRRTRKLVGTLAMVMFIIVYALVAMALLQGRIADLPKGFQIVAYALLGIAWVLPIMPLIRWMETRRPGEE